MLGFVRTVVFAGTVKTSCLSAAYVTANLVPNVIYDIVLGGALTAIVVPDTRGAGRALGARRRARREPGGQPDLVGAADLDGRHPRAREPGPRGRFWPGDLAPDASQPGVRLPA